MKDKVVLITGAAKRVGACVVRTLHASGARVIVHYRGSRSEADKLADELNTVRTDSCVAMQADLTKLEQVKELAEQALAVWGKVDVLVNNASAFYPTPLGSVTEQQWDELFASNVKAPFFLAQSVMESLRSQQGVIVNMVDVHAERPMKDYPVYCMAKAALVMMTKAMARDLAPEVRVNGIAPGMILWPDDEVVDPKTEKYLLNRIALKRFGEPQHIADAIKFLIEHSYLTGQVMAVDGGRSLTI